MILQVLILVAGLLGLVPLALAAWPSLPGLAACLLRTVTARGGRGLGDGRG